MIWIELHHPIIQDGYMISPEGKIRDKHVDEEMAYTASYHSTNGYDFAMFVIKEQYRSDKYVSRLFPIDEIVAMVYIPVPDNIEGKAITVNHINGDTRDISLDNMEWVEDIEIWKDVTYPGVKPGVYRISNRGNVLNIRRNHFVKPRILSGYKYVSLMAVGKGHECSNFRIHRLVAWEFLSSNDLSSEVNHIDIDKMNSYWKNLEWIDRRQNEIHYYSHVQPSEKPTKEKIKRFCNAYIQDEIRDEILNPENDNAVPSIYKRLHDKYPEITIAMIYGVKSNKSRFYRLSNKYDLDKIVYPPAKLLRLNRHNRVSDELIDTIIEELLNPDNMGYPSKVHEKLKKKYPNISLNIIKDIKRKRQNYVNRPIKHDLAALEFPSCKTK